MDIKKIKKESNQIYLKYRKQIIPEFFFVGYVSLLAQYLQSGLFSFFVSLFLCTVGHGYVKCAMKLVDEDNVLLNYHDSMIGIMEFARVAPAYLMRKAVILFLTIICGIPMTFYIKNNLTFLSLDWISSLGNAFIQTELLIPDFEIILMVITHVPILINFFFCIMIYMLLTALLTPVPYIMEQEEFSWNESLLCSIRLMKGKVLQFVHLYIYYLIRHIFYFIVAGLIILFVGKINEILMLFCMIVSLILYIDVFKGRFELAKYLFYKEIRGDRSERCFNN